MFLSIYQSICLYSSLSFINKADWDEACLYWVQLMQRYESYITNISIFFFVLISVISFNWHSLLVCFIKAIAKQTTEWVRVDQHKWQSELIRFRKLIREHFAWVLSDSCVDTTWAKSTVLYIVYRKQTVICNLSVTQHSLQNSNASKQNLRVIHPSIQPYFSSKHLQRTAEKRSMTWCCSLDSRSAELTFQCIAQPVLGHSAVASPEY